MIELTASPTAGPLRRHPDNPRYFADRNGRAVYLTGSHTWDNFQDWGGPAADFDFDAYLAFLAEHKHNFVRLWVWEQTHIDTGAETDIRPQPWARTGPGLAADGKPRFDLSQFDPAYFERLRGRVQALARQGVYASVMLFHEYSVSHARSWDSHPFHKDNNLNGVNGDPDGTGVGRLVHRLSLPAVMDVQRAYLRRVAEAVNDCDNVLFEVGNEFANDTIDWQFWVVETMRQIERGLPTQHPIGLTTRGAGVQEPLITNAVLFNSPADWVSPHNEPGQDYAFDPPAADGRKVVLADTDHILGILNITDPVLTEQWVWKTFTRGLNPIYMDAIQNGIPGHGEPPWNWLANPAFGAARRAMGQARMVASHVDLAGVCPQPERASSGYCLAGAAACVVYTPGGEALEVDVPPGREWRARWYDPITDKWRAAESAVGGRRTFSPPHGGAAVLLVERLRGEP